MNSFKLLTLAALSFSAFAEPPAIPTNLRVPLSYDVLFKDGKDQKTFVQDGVTYAVKDPVGLKACFEGNSTLVRKALNVGFNLVETLQKVVPVPVPGAVIGGAKKVVNTVNVANGLWVAGKDVSAKENPSLWVLSGEELNKMPGIRYFGSMITRKQPVQESDLNKYFIVYKGGIGFKAKYKSYFRRCPIELKVVPVACTANGGGDGSQSANLGVRRDYGSLSSAERRKKDN